MDETKIAKIGITRLTVSCDASYAPADLCDESFGRGDGLLATGVNIHTTLGGVGDQRTDTVDN